MMAFARTAGSGSSLRPTLPRATLQSGISSARTSDGDNSNSCAGLTTVDWTDALDWDKRLGEETGANLYAAQAWGTYKARMNWAVQRIEIRGEDGRALAFVQYQVRRIGFARFVLAQGCPVLTEAGAARAEATLTAFRNHLALGAFDLLGVNFQEFQHNEAAPALLALGFLPVVSPRQHTIELDLTQDMKQIEAGLDPKWRRNLDKARCNPELETSILTGPEERLRAFDTFTEMYAALQARKGFRNTLNPQAYRDIAATDPRLVILEVRESGVPIMVRITHQAKQRWTDFFAASNERGRTTNAAALSVWTLIERAKAEGCPVYDLGGVDPAGNRGVFRFKRGISRRVVQSTPLWLFGRNRFLRTAAAALLVHR